MSSAFRRPRGIDDLLNYRLQRLHAVSGAPVIRLLEGRYGITRREWRLLATLGSSGPLSPSALADACHLDRPRASRAIGSLRDKSLLERAVARGDARRATVALSAAGTALYQELFEQVSAINARMVECLDDTALAALEHALTRLTAAATELNAQLVQDVGADRRVGGARRARVPSSSPEQQEDER